MAYGSSFERPLVPLKPRSKKRGRGGLPQMGMSHAVQDTTEVDRFFRQLSGSMDKIAPRLYDTARRGRKSPHVTVVEGAPVYQHIIESRQRVEPNQLGRIQGKVQDAIGKWLGLPPNPHTVLLTGLQRVGYDDENDGQLTIAAVPHMRTPGTRYVTEEHHIAQDVLTRQVRGYQPPEPASGNPFTPHVVVATFMPGTPQSTIQRCIEAGNGLLNARPLQAYLGALTIFPPMQTALKTS